MSTLPITDPTHPLNVNNTSIGVSIDSIIPDSEKVVGDSMTTIVDQTLFQIQEAASANAVFEDANIVYPSGEPYEEAGVSNPFEVNPVTSEQDATSLMMGYGKKLEDDILKWQRNLAGADRECFFTMAETLPSTGMLVIEPLMSEMELSYKTSAAVASALTTDYDSGNSFEQVNNIKQFNVGQYRVGTSSITSFNTPVFFTGAKQVVTHTEQNFLQADISHNTVKHYWLRAEWGESYCSLRRTSYIIDENITYAANDINYAGGREFYSDGFNHRVGQISAQRLHSERSRGNYGSASTTTIANQNYRSSLGNVNVNGMFNVTINSTIGVVLINSIGLGSVLSTVSSALGTALTHPTSMQDVEEVEKIEFSQPAAPTVGINNNTPHVSNQDIGIGSGANRGSFGSEGAFARYNIDQYEVSNEDVIVIDPEGNVNDRWT